MSKRVIAVLVLLSATPVALADNGLSGRFRATIASPTSIKGVWTISFYGHHQDAHYLNGTKVASGTCTSSGSTISFATRGPNRTEAVQHRRQVSVHAHRRPPAFHQSHRPLRDPMRAELLSHPFIKL